MRYTEPELLVSSSGSSLVSPPPSLLPPQFGSDYDDGMDSNLGGQGLLSFAYESHHPISTQSQSQRFSGGGVLSGSYSIAMQQLFSVHVLFIIFTYICEGILVHYPVCFGIFSLID